MTKDKPQPTEAIAEEENGRSIGIDTNVAGTEQTLPRPQSTPTEKVGYTTKGDIDWEGWAKRERPGDFNFINWRRYQPTEAIAEEGNGNNTVNSGGSDRGLTDRNILGEEPAAVPSRQELTRPDAIEGLVERLETLRLVEKANVAPWIGEVANWAATELTRLSGEVERLKQSLGASERFRLEDNLGISAQLTRLQGEVERLEKLLAFRSQVHLDHAAALQSQLAACREALEKIEPDLLMLGKAIAAGDPIRELLLRVSDTRTIARAALKGDG